MAELLYVYAIRRRIAQSNLWNSWRLKDVKNPFELHEQDFVNRFRLSRETATILIAELRSHMPERNRGYSIELQVLICLQIMGTGSFQSVVADSLFAQISQASVSRFFQVFLTAMMKIFGNHIQFPTTMYEIQTVCLGFYSKFGFPNVCGAIDCTHVYIDKPSCTDWNNYLNRKGRFSINVQMVCDSDLKVLDVVARWPGSCHDSFIWRFSGVKNLLYSMQHKKYLLGDSGYPLENCLLTPYIDPVAPQEQLFNKKHRTTRNVIERCFGVMKSRFRVLDSSGGILVYTPQKSCKIIIAAAVLHNMCVRYRVELPYEEHEEDDGNEEEEDDDDMDLFPSHQNRTARILRDEVAFMFQAAT